MDSVSLQDYKNRNSFLKTFKDDSRSIPEILQDNLEKGVIDQNLYDAAIGQYIDVLEKGGKRAQVGEIREFGGKKYIKTKTGPNSWKPYSPGGKHEHLTGGEKKESTNPDKKEKENSLSANDQKIVSDFKNSLVSRMNKLKASGDLPDRKGGGFIYGGSWRTIGGPSGGAKIGQYDYEIHNMFFRLAYQLKGKPEEQKKWIDELDKQGIKISDISNDYLEYDRNNFSVDFKIDAIGGDSGKEEKSEVKDTSVLPEPSTNKISSAINSYKHSEDTVKEIQAHIDYHQKIYDGYQAEMKKLDASKSKEDWDNYFKIKDRAQPHINAVLAFKMAKAASEILQEHKADKGIGLSDTRGQMSLFSDTRALLNRALSYKKEAKEKVE